MVRASKSPAPYPICGIDFGAGSTYPLSLASSFFKNFEILLVYLSVMSVVAAWKRGVDESLAGYELFLLYLSLGSGRTVGKLRRRLSSGGVRGKTLSGQVRFLMGAGGDWGSRAAACEAAVACGELLCFPLPSSRWLRGLCGDVCDSVVDVVDGAPLVVGGNVDHARDDVNAWRGRLKSAAIGWNAVCSANVERLMARISEFTDADFSSLGPKDVVVMIGTLQKLQKEALDVEAAAIGAGDILDQLASLDSGDSSAVDSSDVDLVE